MLPIALKYVMFRGHADDTIEVRFAIAPATHKQLADELSRTHAPTSAGFVEILSDGTVRTYGSSTSLCMVPHAEDARFITAMMRATHRTSNHPSAVAAQRMVAAAPSFPSATATH